MFLSRLAYISRPAWHDLDPGARESMLADILAAGMRNNPARKIIGVLIFDGRNFVQVLEGRRSVVYETFLRIQADTRHGGVELVGFSEVSDRLFDGWAVLSSPPAEAARRGVAIPDPDTVTFDMLVAFARRHRSRLDEVHQLAPVQAETCLN